MYFDRIVCLPKVLSDSPLLPTHLLILFPLANKTKNEKQEK